MNISDEELEGSLAQILGFCRKRRLQRNKVVFDRIAEIIAAQDDERLEGEALRRSRERKYESAVSLLLLIADSPDQEVLDVALQKIRKATHSDIQNVRFLDDSQDSSSLRDALGVRRKFDDKEEVTLKLFRDRVASREWSRGRKFPPEGDNRG